MLVKTSNRGVFFFFLCEKVSVDVIHHCKDDRHIYRFYVDAFSLKSNLVVTNGFECRSSCTYRSYVDRAHAVIDSAYCGKSVKVSLERVGIGICAEFFGQRIFDVHLAKDVAHCHLSAHRIASVSKIHFVKFIGECVYQNRNVCICESHCRSVLVAEVRKRENYSVILSLIVFEKFSVQFSFVYCLYRPIACEIFVHNYVSVTVFLTSRTKTFASLCDYFAGEKTAVAKEKSKSCFFHKITSLVFIM